MAYITPEQALQRFLPKRKAGQAAPSHQVISFDKTVGDKGLLYIIKNETSGKSYLTPADGDLYHTIGEWDTDYGNEELPVNMQDWLASYEQEIEWYQQNKKKNSQQTDSPLKAGAALVVESTNSTNDFTEYFIQGVPQYDQGSPYNSKLTYGDYLDFTDRSCWPATGCSATSAVQVMVYWGKKGYYIGCRKIEPYTRNDSSDDYRVGGGYYVDANLPPISNFDFSNMLDNYYHVQASDVQKDAIATIMQYTALAMHSRPVYSSKSGRYTGGTDAYPKYKVAGLRDKFCLDTVAYSEKNWTNCIKSSWNNIVYGVYLNGKMSDTPCIYSEIKEGCPVILSGSRPNGVGHAFVCKGFKNVLVDDVLHTYFYIDWGFNSGTNRNKNGWFLSSALDYNNREDNGYNASRLAIFTHPRYSKDNIDHTVINSILVDISDKKGATKANDITYDEKLATDDVETISGYVINDMDKTDNTKRKTFKLASLVVIRKACREILNSLSKLGYNE